MVLHMKQLLWANTQVLKCQIELEHSLFCWDNPLSTPATVHEYPH